MKKDTEKKFPMTPLWIADALMFAAVFIIAVPSLRSATAMSWGQTLLCCALVATAMGMLLAAYWLNAKIEIKRAQTADDDAQKDSEIIFEELGALRMMLADSNEKIESLEFIADDAKKTAEKVAVFESGITLLRDSVQKKFKEVSEEIERVAKRAEDFSAKNSALLKKDLADFNVDFLELKESVASAEDSVKKELESLRRQLNETEESLSALTNMQANQNQADAPEGAEQSELSGVLSRALSGGANVGGTVDKFVNFKKVEGQKEPREAQVQEIQQRDSVIFDKQKSEGEKLNDEPLVFAEGGEKEDATQDTLENISDPQAEPIPGEYNAEDKPNINIADAPQASETDNPADTPSPKDSKKSFDGGTISTEEANEDFFEQANSDKSVNATEFANQNALNKNVSEPTDNLVSEKDAQSKLESVPEKIPAEKNVADFLFGEMPLSWPKKAKPSKHDAVIVVNALIGIGNKPYLRGNGGGLSMQKGVPMQFVEIGKWRYVIVELTQPIEIQILKNDEDAPLDAQVYQLEAGQKLELNLNFPLKEQY